jgi:hypothetical protein
LPGSPTVRKLDDFIGARLNAYAATGAELGVKVKNDGFAVLDFVDLLLGYRIFGMELESVDRTCHHAVVAACTSFHIDVQCKCHGYHAPDLID